MFRTKDLLPMEGTHDGLPDNELLLSNLGKSIYDFNDDDDRDDDCFGNLAIDESPKRSKKSNSQGKVKSSKGKRVPAELEGEPKNGIESLLKASALTTIG